MLCKGLYFALALNNLKFENYLFPCELLFGNAYEKGDRNEFLLHLKSKIKDVVTLGYLHMEFVIIKIIVTEIFRGIWCSINLRNNKDLIIQKTEKGSTMTVVLLKGSSYLTQMEEVLSDKFKFVQVTFNPKHEINKEV